MSRFNLIRPTASYLKEKLNLTTEEEEVAVFGLQLIFYPIIGNLSVLIVGWLLGCFWTTFAVLITIVALRLLSGGAHSNTPLICYLMGIVFVPLLGKLAQLTVPFLSSLSLSVAIIIGLMVSLVIFLRLAPVDCPAKPITDTAQRRKLRFYSIILILVFTAGQCLLLCNDKTLDLVWAVSLGLWWQAFSLTASGHRFAAFIDNLFMKGGE
ncbi:MAG: accessory gene regulator B family protein [Bacillota bacterium]